jgi:hypothetical protein
VIVNRIWRWHMGRGIADTPNNLGIAGDRPTNAELLDYLASKFIADGMSWKKLHKDILMSRTYQLSATPVEANRSKDPDNRFFWRANRVRLEAEGVWDSLLQASGALDLKDTGGPSEDLSEKMVRRAVYAKVSRMYPNDFQATFDLPTATISAEKRYATNVPQQRLFFLNNRFVQTQAETLAQRVKSAGDEQAQITKAYEIIYQRSPEADELGAALKFLRIPPQPPPGATTAPAGEDVKTAPPGEDEDKDKEAATPRPDSLLRSFCWALLSSNEFVYID